jgi:Asp-tRNA(Asn)/Glu-tRNA(Gln) amidotransferase A subunit family amidase
MTKARREFLKRSAFGLAATAIAPATTAGAGAKTDPQTPPELPPGAPPAFGTGPKTGPAVTPQTFAEAEKLVQVQLTEKEREQAAKNWQVSMAPLYERRTGPRKITIDDETAPASRWYPASIRGAQVAGSQDRFIPANRPPRPFPPNEEDVAYAGIPDLARWIQTKQITSERLTTICLNRLARFQPRINATITLTTDLALLQARRADNAIAKGEYKGPLHGIPWGAKDLLDTKGIATTYGAEPFRGRKPDKNATVVERLAQAGAVLVGKLSLGALALNDIWFGGQTNNPWLPAEGSSGSSAGPGAALAAGCVPFAIASETGGSIIGPAMRNGVTGLRPTYGRVPRTGAMTLCWSLDKLGPMARYVEDTLIVLKEISGPDPGDPSSVPSHLDYDANAPIAGLRVGYIKRWMDEPPATAVDRKALDTIRTLGMETREVTLPDWPYSSLNVILFAEAAAAFEDLTLTRGVDQLRMQVPDAWPNIFRQSRFLSAVDYVQADRFRRKVALEMARIFDTVDVLLVPSLRDEMLTISNHTGHPSLTLRAGFVEIGQARSDWAPDPAHPMPTFYEKPRVPHGITLIGHLFDEGLLGRVGIALERAFAVAEERPPGF